MPYEDRLNIMHLQKLSACRKYIGILILYKIIHGLAPISIHDINISASNKNYIHRNGGYIYILIYLVMLYVMKLFFMRSISLENKLLFEVVKSI